MVEIFAQYQDFALFLMRLVLGTIMIVHGVPKVKNFQGVAQWLESIGLKPGKFWNVVLILIEVAGGALLVLGFLVEYIALVMAVEMVIAAVAAGRKKGFKGGWEFELALFALAVALLILGGGVYSIAAYF